MTVQASGGGGYASGHGGGGQGSASAMAMEPVSHCTAVLLIAGEAFPCDWPVGPFGTHAGWGHTNKDAQAVWNG